jgi:hypothetical protein
LAECFDFGSAKENIVNGILLDEVSYCDEFEGMRWGLHYNNFTT